MDSATQPVRSSSCSSIFELTSTGEIATLLIHPDNTASLKVAERKGFKRANDVEQRTFWRRPVREPN